MYVRNLPFKITADELYAIFGKYGAVYQIRLGDKNKDTRGTAFVVYEDIYDAKAAVDHLSGFNVGGRYLVVLVRHDETLLPMDYSIDIFSSNSVCDKSTINPLNFRDEPKLRRSRRNWKSCANESMPTKARWRSNQRSRPRQERDKAFCYG